MDTIDVEVILKQQSKVPIRKVISLVSCYFKTKSIQPNSIIKNFGPDEDLSLYENVELVVVGDYPLHDGLPLNFNDCRISWHVYSLDNTGPNVENDEDGDGKEINLATHWLLPSKDFFNLWENLFYDDNIKEKLLKYALTIMKFSDKGVDCNIVSCNKVILLHGPPGTGKTSLCKALAQKLSVRLLERYDSGVFVEINSHNLFSKWFSESGKLVSKMFAKIKEVVEDRRLLVCVLIDEIESLVHERNQCISGTEPTDSVKVVNAVLTQIDQIKRYPNVLILTTSNMTGAIDLAFVDRADVKQFLGLPSVRAIYQIYYTCIQELIKVGLIFGENTLSPASVFRNLTETTNGEVSEDSKTLMKICEKSEGLSGRSLRKIPFLTHALFLENKSTYSMTEFLVAMEKAVEHEKKELQHFKKL